MIKKKRGGMLPSQTLRGGSSSNNVLKREKDQLWVGRKELRLWEEVGLRLVLERMLSEDGEKTSMFDRAVHGSEWWRKDGEGTSL